MADFNRCISALNRAAGRELDADELADIMDRIQRTAKGLRDGTVKPEAGASMASVEGVVFHAAQLQAAEAVREAERKAANAVRGAKVMATRQAELAAMKTAGMSGVESVRRLIENMADGKTDSFSLESKYLGASAYLKRKVQDTWLAMDKTMLEHLQREDKFRNLLREMRGENTGDAVAKQAAKVWLDAAEEARQWYNQNGGKIGHLENWGGPQHHSQDLVSRAAVPEWLESLPAGKRTIEWLRDNTPGREANQRAWVDYILPKLDRSKYTDLAGNPMSDAEVRSFLEHAWESIAMGGVNKLEPGQFKGTGGRANRHAEQRQIHFKDADAQIEYWKRFGDKSVPDILLGHLDTLAKDIAFLEHFGPNPDAAYRVLRDTEYKAAVDAAPERMGKITSELRKTDRAYNYAAGITEPVANQRVADAFSVVHNLNAAGKLGGAALSSLFGDKPMFEAMARVNNLPAMQLWQNEMRLLSGAGGAAERRLLRRQGLMLEYMSNSLYRFGDELGKSSLTGKLANGVMKVTGLSFVNDMRRGAWSLTAMDTIGHLVSTKEFRNISGDDMRLLKTYGISEHDWNVWRLAEVDDLGHGNNTALTPDSIARITDEQLRAANLIGQAEDGTQVRRDATVKLLGALTAESHVAVIEPGWHERAMMYGGLQRGTVKGELIKAFMQFKAFPFTQFEKMMQVGMSRPTTGGKAGFIASIVLMQTIAGAMLIQTQEMLAGKDPRPMWDWKFLGAAFLKGGTLGLYGDFLFSQSGTTRYGTGPLEAVAGPTIGAAADLATFVAQAPGLAAQGKEPMVAAKALGLAKGFVPGANMWFTKAATDHFIFQAAQEALNPGYLDSMRDRTHREFGNDYYWRPGAGLPDRGPDIGAALESR